MACAATGAASFQDLRLEQIRQLIDVEQIFAAFSAMDGTKRRRFSGSMTWKEVGGHAYLYRKRHGAWASLGPRSESTEQTFRRFHDGRDHHRDRMARLAARLDEMAPVNRALKLGRVPLVLARSARALRRAGLMGTRLQIVGTNALYAYERLAGVQLEGGHLATIDADLLFDARARIRLAGRQVESGTILELLRAADRSFELTGPGSFRAVNRDGYMVDVIQPMPSDQMAQSHLPAAAGDIRAVEIEGLSWLVSSPKMRVTVIDERGYPVQFAVADPRAFAAHKLWLASRSDRDPAKRIRDRAQADLLIRLVRERFPSPGFDDRSLGAIPRSLREAAQEIAVGLPGRNAASRSTEPGW